MSKKKNFALAMKKYALVAPKLINNTLIKQEISIDSHLVM